MTAPSPRVAIIGAGLMGRWHADAVRRIGGRVTVIVDTDTAARGVLGRRHPEATVLASLDPALIAAQATAAHVCSPLSTHSSTVDALVDAGIHALVEKPFCENAESTVMVTSRAQSRGVLVCPVHQFLFQDGVRKVVEWLPQLGTPRRIEFSTCSAGAEGGSAEALDDLIAEILPHPLSLIQLLTRLPVAPVRWDVVHPAPGEFRALSTVGGVIVDVAISARGRPTENMLRVVADGGTVTADLFHGFAVRHSANVSRRGKIAAPFVSSGKVLGGASLNLMRRAGRREPAYPGLRELIGAFHSAIAEGRSSPIPADAIVDVATARDQLLVQLEGA
jgi:predicted dehydrogenase